MSVPQHALVVIERGVALPANWHGHRADVTVLAEESDESPQSFAERVTTRVARLVTLSSIADVRLFTSESADVERLAARAKMVRALLAHVAASTRMTFLAIRGQQAQNDLFGLMDAVRPLAKTNVLLRLELRDEMPGPTAAWA